jgi:pyridoxal 5'-phosphate synthase pdxT subunit
VEGQVQIGVLAVQGDVREHGVMLRALGARVSEVRTERELEGLDGLVIPGGESTAIGRLVRLYGLEEPLRRFPGALFGTCAGMILLARTSVDGVPDQQHLGLIDITVRRNAFGRQVASFEADLDVDGEDEPVHAVFIRAPWIEESGPKVEVLAQVDGHPVLAREGRVLVAAFHPELTDDTRIHELFLDAVRGKIGVRA